MTREEVTAKITETGIIPAIRVASVEEALFAAEAVFSGGIHVVELTTTVPDAPEAISRLVKGSGHAVVGAGTVLDEDTARRCLDAGAAFLTSPGFDHEVAEFAISNRVVYIPGALTPTEVMMARKAGADFIKVFPCGSVGGSSWIRALHMPFPHIPLIASGGISWNTAADFLRAGAVAVGIGEGLIPPEAVRLRNAHWIRELVRRITMVLAAARKGGH